VSGAQVTLLSSSDEKLERARELGISQLINYKKNVNWEKAVLDITGGKGVDYVVEIVGGNNVDRSISALATERSASPRIHPDSSKTASLSAKTG
jgi:NADPH:quinone reductase-like Zn-dependent oxidoreductase